MEPIKGACHCGRIKFEVVGEPMYGLVTCNCSICRRYGALWAHQNMDEVTIEASEAATNQYIWGDKGLAFQTCKECGCTTHFSPVDGVGPMMGLNYRLVDDPQQIADFPTRNHDGARSDTF